jgi:hypothetical protein
LIVSILSPTFMQESLETSDPISSIEYPPSLSLELSTVDNSALLSFKNFE